MFDGDGLCPLYGDFGCSVVSAKIEKDGATVEWSVFGYENSCNGQFFPIERLGPFRFNLIE